MTTHETSPARKSTTDLCHEAFEAFWDVVAKRFSLAKYGDLSPERTIRLQFAAEEAVEEWISTNVPVLCKNCGSEIVETVNDSNFRGGECNACEYERYRRHAAALDAAHGLFELIKTLRENGCDLFDHHEPLLSHCRAVLLEQDKAFPKNAPHGDAA
jgi:hypothetical protein